jgi:hypothetical protein
MSVGSRDSYMSSTQAGQAMWAATFVAVVQPDFAAYGLTEAEFDAFKDLNIDLQAKWTAWNANPNHRTKAMRVAKDSAFSAMRAEAKYLVRKIQGTRTVTDEMKSDAGLTIYKTTLTPKPIPATAPVIGTTLKPNRVVALTLSESVGKKSKPSNVAGAVVFYAIGEEPPATVDGWTFSNVTTKSSVEIPFPTGPAQTVYITAFWTNSRDETGPSATPVRVDLPAGTALVGESGEDSLRLAA